MGIVRFGDKIYRLRQASLRIFQRGSGLEALRGQRYGHGGVLSV